MVDIVHISVAGLIFTVKSEVVNLLLTELWRNYFNTFYKGFLIEKPEVEPAAEIILKTKQDWSMKGKGNNLFLKTDKAVLGKFNFKVKRGEFDVFSSFFQFDLFLKAIFSVVIAENNGVLLHGSAVVVKKNGRRIPFVFLAPKQTGKSTIIKLCPFPKEVYADDNVILRADNKRRIFLYPTLFWEKERPRESFGDFLPVRLENIFILGQSKTNEIVTFNKKGDRILSFWRSIKSPQCLLSVKNLSIFQVLFTPDQYIWSLLLKKLS